MFTRLYMETTIFYNKCLTYSATVKCIINRADGQIISSDIVANSTVLFPGSSERETFTSAATSSNGKMGRARPIGSRASGFYSDAHRNWSKVK